MRTNTIIGGLVVQVEGRLIDGSVRAQLEAMRQLSAGGGAGEVGRGGPGVQCG